MVQERTINQRLATNELVAEGILNDLDLFKSKLPKEKLAQLVTESTKGGKANIDASKANAATPGDSVLA